VRREPACLHPARKACQNEGVFDASISRPENIFVGGGACDTVGLAIAEHLPWDTLAARDMLRELPLTHR
jgi:hypothetical protein